MAKSGADVSVFRRLALALPDVVEMSHMGAADFRIQRGDKLRIFATLAYGAKGLGTLMLTAAQQAMFLAEAPEYFSAAPGGWGRMGGDISAGGCSGRGAGGCAGDGAPASAGQDAAEAEGEESRLTPRMVAGASREYESV